MSICLIFSSEIKTVSEWIEGGSRSLHCLFHLFCVKFASQKITMLGLLMISKNLCIKMAVCTLDLDSEFGLL